MSYDKFSPAFLLVFATFALSAGARSAENSCIDCHQQPEFYAQYPKLHEYFQQYEVSPHNQAGVTCDDCHGGDAGAESAQRAHVGVLPMSDPKSTVYYQEQPDTCGQNSFLSPYGSDYFYAIHSLMLDQPYVGRKTHDVLCVLDWLANSGHTEVHLVAKGWGAIPATFAALFADEVVQVTLKNALTSYADIAQSETYQWPLSSLVPDVLEKFDLPECYAELSGKKLHQIEPWNANATG